MKPQCKNYMKNGDELVIGGTLTIEEGATATGLPETAQAQAAAQADSVATDVAGVVTDFNALLAKLRAAGLMAAE